MGYILNRKEFLLEKFVKVGENTDITDNEKVLGFPKDFTMTITDIKVYNGAGYIVLYMGNVLTMPGLAKESNYLKDKYE